MAAKIATIVGDVTGLQQRHHPQNISHLVKIKGFPLKVKSFQNTETYQKLISRIIAFVYDPVKPCCFNSQVNIYSDDFQLPKTVYILVRFSSNKLYILVDKGCLMLQPLSTL